jgi:hypothetical protein
MNNPHDTDASLRLALRSIYEEVMWLSRRPNATPGRARAWYTHNMAESVKRNIRLFTGSISEAVIEPLGNLLMLERYLGIQTTLSTLVEKHRAADLDNLEEFIDMLIKYEQIHIATRAGNYAAMRSKGNYATGGNSFCSVERSPAAKLYQTNHYKIGFRVASANRSEHLKTGGFLAHDTNQFPPSTVICTLRRIRANSTRFAPG